MSASPKYAIVNISGIHVKVSEGQKVKCNLLPNKAGDKVQFDEVLMYNTGSDLKVGAPLLSGAKVSATVEKHFKDKKVLVFKYLRKNRSKKLNGHRQQYSLIKINKIEG